MVKKITLSPITRANGPAWIEVHVEGGRVVRATCSGIFFRGFEVFLKGRDPRDASYLTERICGICSTAHGTAAAMALEDLVGIMPPRNGVILRNLILGADFLQNHIRHFYLLGLLDYVQGPDSAPFIPRYTKDFRLSKKVSEQFMRHYFQAAEVSRLAHEMVAMLGAKAPHQHGTIAGGSTITPTADVLLDFGAKLKQINAFVREHLVPDAWTLAEAYPDYYEIGRRDANLLEYGLFPMGEKDTQRFFPGGAVLAGQMEELDLGAIKEHIKYSWFEGESDPVHPQSGETIPKPDKEEAYSWVKAPRYKGRACEGGPLARLWLKGVYRRGISTMDRILARVLEAELIGKAMEEWINMLEPGKPVFTPYEVPEKGEGTGLTGAMRGPLMHWVRIKNKRIAHYQIVTPTAWNFSPRDSLGQPGPIEEALLGTPVADEKQPVEIGRVVRAFDVCFSCATHVIVHGRRTVEIIV